MDSPSAKYLDAVFQQPTVCVGGKMSLDMQGVNLQVPNLRFTQTYVPTNSTNLSRDDLLAVQALGNINIHIDLQYRYSNRLYIPAHSNYLERQSRTVRYLAMPSCSFS